jgi:hypothetical protein
LAAAYFYCSLICAGDYMARSFLCLPTFLTLGRAGNFFLLEGKCYHFDFKESKLSGAVSNSGELVCAGAAIEHGSFRAAQYFSNSFGAYSGLRLG